MRGSTRDRTSVALPSAHPLDPRLDRMLREHALVRRFVAGAEMIPRREPAPGLWTMQSGATAAMGLRLDGREFTFALRQPGEWFAETTLLDGLPSAYRYVAASKAIALRVPHAAATRLVSAHPELRRALERLTCLRLRDVSRYIELLAESDLPARLAGRLVSLGAAGRDVSGTLVVRASQTVLAEMIGATREAVGRNLIAWEREGWIALGYRKVIILKPEALIEVMSAVTTPPRPSPSRERLSRNTSTPDRSRGRFPRTHT